MSSKQALIKELDTLPPDFIDDVLQYVSFLKFKFKAPSNSDTRLNDFDILVSLIRTAANEPMPPIEPIHLREVES